MPPRRFDFAARGREFSEEIMAGIEAWRLPHPQATLREMEAAVDDRLAERRARRLQDGALASQAAAVSPNHCLGAAGLSALWDAGGASRAARAPGDDTLGLNPALAAQRCALPGLSGRVFPPSMKRWGGGRGSSPRGCRRVWCA
jgi:hypothetical protein